MAAYPRNVEVHVACVMAEIGLSGDDVDDRVRSCWAKRCCGWLRHDRDMSSPELPIAVRGAATLSLTWALHDVTMG